MLEAGVAAPDFSLHVTADQTLALRALRGRPVIGVLSRRLEPGLRRPDWRFTTKSCLISRNSMPSCCGISVDGVWCHGAFAENRHLHFPLLADFEPKGAVARQFGVYREADGITERALFVIDKNGMITWSYCSPIAVNPGADGILEALENCQNRRSLWPH